MNHIFTFLKPFSVLPALILMCMIFGFSAQPGEESSHLSYEISCRIVESVDHLTGAGLGQEEIAAWADRIHGGIRKLAHMSEYFALAVAVAFPFLVYQVRGFRMLLFTAVICVVFAASDELHQAFVGGRSPALRDVGIDSIGVFFGLIFITILRWPGRLRRQKKG